MFLATISFWNESSNSYGIPDTFHSYLISVFVNEIFKNGDKIVKIIPLTSDAPKPPHNRPFIIKNSSKENAIIEAFNILKEMPEMKDLRCSKTILDMGEKNLKFVTNY
jgi:hypothetical protein